MPRPIVGIFAAVSLIVIGSAYAITGLPSAADKAVRTADYSLASVDALVLVPLANQEYADTANELYLKPLGFDGAATVFITPTESNEVASVAPGVQALVQEVGSEWTLGKFSSEDPLYIFGYSQGAVEQSLAEQQLHELGIPYDALHFVMVGDSASAMGGILNSFVDSLPESWQQSTTDLLALFGIAPPVLGAVTPDDLFLTDVYTISTDGWANWDDGANIYGMFTQHLEYLGLSPSEIAGATVTSDGYTNYHLIDGSSVNDLAALYNQLLLALEISPVNAAAAEATQSAASTLLSQLETMDWSAADFATLGADLHTWGADLAAELIGALNI